ncbi:unnamed protein product [Paramecium sonneborni]|uniref:Uncharacterized protein n=1 Tax=Paramecium sonneborni TaxID=65129 RepID=A0A8S1LRR8_9CILI|nr:unnamed protein product [Paramecium sonneborni]
MGYSKLKQINVTMIQGIQSGGGLYDLEGNQKKIGKWIEQDKFFKAIKQVTYTGEYNINSMKVGKWDIMFTKSIDQPYQYMQILHEYKEYSGGGSYDQQGYQKKIGKWIELDNFFSLIKQITYNGEYNINGMKVGGWDMWFQRLFGDKYEHIGGGFYDQEGNQKKIGKWVDLDEKFETLNEITYIGEYNTNGMKVCRWDILNRNKQIGGGSYDQEGNQKMIGNWIQLDKEFYHLKEVTYNGEYNLNGIKIGRWDTVYCKYEEKEYKLIGGGFYDQQGNQKKIGKWLELDERFNYERQLIYQGEYNMNGAKVGRWDIMYFIYSSMEYKQIGGGSYEQEGNEKKIGKWIELDQYFNSNQSFYKGEYNMNGMKVGRWDIMYRKFGREYIQMQINIRISNIVEADYLIQKEISLESGLRLHNPMRSHRMVNTMQMV